MPIQPTDNSLGHRLSHISPKTEMFSLSIKGCHQKTEDWEDCQETNVLVAALAWGWQMIPFCLSRWLAEG